MKRAMRKKMQAALEAMPPAVAAAKSRQACQAVLALEEFRSARTVMIYVPIPGEVDAAPLAQAAWQDGKTLLVPQVFWLKWRMIPVVCRSLDDEDLTPPHFGIRHPRHSQPWPLEEIDLVIAPALAFDRRGHRLGRGGGFYDRFLASPQLRAIDCGLGFAEQMVDELPIGGEDHPLDILVTDQDVLRFEHHHY
jgi:5-formyltetrahydrofolate cyclo-ligase